MREVYIEVCHMSDLYYMRKFEKGDEGEKHIQLFSGSVRMLLPTLI